MSKNLLVTSLSVLTMVSALAAYAQDVSSPPRNGRQLNPAVQHNTQLPANTVTAVIVKSWGDNPVWADLTANWSTYGTIPVSIDDTTLISGDFTYADLVNSNANVVIMSDPAGGLQQYSPAEIAAILQYARAGHSVLGTYIVFQWNSTDNRGLAPVFGLSSSLSYEALSIDNEFEKVSQGCLLNKISGSSWLSNGYPQSQVPSSGSWTGNLGTAKAVADSDSYIGVVTVHHTKAFDGVYVSNMPEYQVTGGDDEQLLYNAITCFPGSSYGAK